MPNVISIDPGKRKVAYAVWDYDTGSLLRAGLVTHDPSPGDERAQQWKDIAYWTELAAGLGRIDNRLVIEIPQVYEGYQDEDKNDLIDLAGVVGALSAHVWGRVEWSPTPREWKGQLPKAITQKRVDAELNDAEKALIEWPAKNLRHNVYDALHLGLTYLKREGIRLPDRYPQ
jgi:hypothetical protein